MSTMSLAISGTSIRQDSNGRFCLNDLHKAAGGERRHEIANWTALQQTKDLIAELTAEKSTPGIPVVEQNQPVNYDTGIPVSSFSPIETVKGRGKVQGTFVVKELVYAYATWISAKFFLSVIRAYDSLVSKPVPNALHDLPKDDRMTLISKRELESLRKVAPKPIAWGNYATMMLALPTDQRVRWMITNHAGTTVINPIEPDVLVGIPEHVIRELKILGYHVIKDDPQNKLETIEKIVTAKFAA
jgi:hypothetical protein